MTPLLVQALRDIDIKLIGIGDLETPNSWREALTDWFASATNGIKKVFVGEVHTDKLCVKKSDGLDICLTGDQLQNLLGSEAEVIVNTPVVVEPEIIIVDTPPAVEPEVVEPVVVDEPQSEEVLP